MKINFQKAVPITIFIGAAVIITLTGIWYGFNWETTTFIALFAAAGIAIGIDKYISYRKHKK